MNEVIRPRSGDESEITLGCFPNKSIEKAAGRNPFAEVPAALVNLNITKADPSHDL